MRLFSRLWGLILVLSILALSSLLGCSLFTSMDQFSESPDAGLESEAGQDAPRQDAPWQDAPTADSDAAVMAARVEPTEHDFGLMTVGSISAPFEFTITNPNESRTLSPVTTSFEDTTEDFAIVGDGCMTLAPGASCTVEVVFLPKTPGPAVNHLTVMSGDYGSTSVEVRGVGAPPATLGISPVSQDFGSMGVGMASPASAFVVSNPGTDMTSPLSISLEGPDAADFAITSNDCDQEVLGPNDTCSFSLRFEPSSLGEKNANVVVMNDTAVGVSAQVTGSGVESVVLDLAPPSWDFGTVEPSTVSLSNTFTLSNDGVASSGAIAVALEGPDAAAFQLLSDTCTGMTLAPAATCEINVVFAPDVEGARTATLHVQDGAVETQADLAGLAGVPVLTATPSSVVFPDTAATHTSANVTVSVTNGGPGIANNVQVGLDGTDPLSFSLSSDTCSGSTLDAGQSCTVDVSFSPSDPGTFSAVLRAESGEHSAVVNLSGHGLTPASLTLEPSLHDFGTVGVGITSAPWTLTVTNKGEAASGPLTLDLSDQFSMSSLCDPNGILGGTSCEIDVSFAPTVTGPATGTLTVSNGSSQAVASFQGTGTDEPILAIEPVVGQFPATELGASSAALHFTVTNYGVGDTGLLSTVVGAPAEFILSSDGCDGNALASLESCTISVVFHPDTLGIHTTNLTVTASPGGTAHAALSGSGANPATLELTPDITDFGAIEKDGTASAGVILQNTGGSTTGEISLDISPAGPFSIATDGCSGTTLGPGAACSLLVEFHPANYDIYESILSASETGGATAQATLRGKTADIFVNQATGNDAFHGHSAMFAKKTITAGLAAAETGWTVHVAAGNYGNNETFPLSPPEASTVLAEGSVSVEPTGGNATSVFQLANTDVTLDGFVLRPGTLTSPKLADVAAKRTTLSNLTLECLPTSGYCTGIYADEHNLTVNDVTITFSSPTSGGTGISMGRCISNFTNVSITCVPTTGSVQQSGVAVWDYGATLFENLHVSSCSQGLYVAEGDVTLRNSTIQDSFDDGVIIYVDPMGGNPLDMGTAADPGNNTIQSANGVGLSMNLWGNDSFTLSAHGNTWNPNVQGADADGHYAAQVVDGPVVEVAGNNYMLVTTQGSGVASAQF